MYYLSHFQHSSRNQLVTDNAMAKKRAHSIMRRYTNIEWKIICKAIEGSGKDDEIVSTCGTDTLQRASMHTLKPKNWVCDEVIHFYYKLLARRDGQLWKTDPTHEETYFSKSFFFGQNDE